MEDDREGPDELLQRLDAANAALHLARADRRRLAAEFKTLHEVLESERHQREATEADLKRRSGGQLWEWAEEELRRAQESLQRNRAKLQRAEEEVVRLRKDRDWVEQRRQRGEDELQQLREDLEKAEQRAREAEREQVEAIELAQRATRGRHLPGVRGVSRGVAAARDAAALVPDNGGAASVASGGELPAEQGIDWATALAGVDGDVECLRAIAGMFCGDASRLLRDLRDAVDAVDARAVVNGARVLKGAARSVAAGAAVQAAARLEAIGRSREFGEAEEAYIALQVEIERVKPALEALQQGTPVRG